MNALVVAITYNNIGVSLLETGSHEESLEIFRGSAELMFVATRTVNEQCPQASARVDKKINQVVGKLQHILSEAKPKQGKYDSRREADCFLHHTAIRLLPQSESQAPCDGALESATVLFNMALAYHLASPLPCQTCTSLHNALTLYDMAYSVAARIDNEFGSQRVICAALNNLGYLHHELGRYSTSREYLDKLSSYIVSLDPNQADKTVKSERRQFLLNALLLYKPRGAAAA